MTRRDKIGIGVVSLILVGLLILLVWSSDRPSGKIHPPEKSIFVEQRINNLQKSR